MINEYIDCTEFMRLIEDQKIKPSVVKRYLKEQGMVFTSTNAHELAANVYTIFLGCQEMDRLKQVIMHEANYEKSVLVNSELTVDSGDILDYFADEFNKRRSSGYKGISIEQPIISNNTMYLQLSYTKKVPGKNRFLKDTTHSVQIQIRKRNERAASIDIRQQSSTDYQRVLELLAAITGNQEESELTIKHVNLQVLLPQSRVSFFDELANKQYPNWRLKTITGITVKKLSASEDEEEEEISADEQEQPMGTLAGINQAVLHGNGLRSNEFVQTCLNQGFEITSMKYRYESKQEAIEFVVSVSSKNEDLRIDIDKSYAEEDGRLYHQPLPKSDQDEIILAVQTEANNIYDTLREKQREAPTVEAVVVPMVP